MILPMLWKNLILLLDKKLFEMFPTQNLLRYLPQRDQKKAGGIWA